MSITNVTSFGPEATRLASGSANVFTFHRHCPGWGAVHCEASPDVGIGTEKRASASAKTAEKTTRPIRCFTFHPPNPALMHANSRGRPSGSATSIAMTLMGYPTCGVGAAAQLDGSMKRLTLPTLVVAISANGEPIRAQVG